MNYERLSMKVRQYQHHISNTTNPFQHSATSTPPNIIFLTLIETGQTRTRGNEQMKLTHMSTINVTLIDKLLQVDAPG